MPWDIGEVSTGQSVGVWGRTSRGYWLWSHQINLGFSDSLLHSGAKATPANGLRTHNVRHALLQWLFLGNRVAGWGHVLSLPRTPREDLRPCPLLLPKFSGQGRPWMLELGGSDRGVFLQESFLDSGYPEDVTSQPKAPESSQTRRCLALKLPQYFLSNFMPFLCAGDPG